MDGVSIVGQSNHQAVECLRNTGIVVTISFERYLRGPKYEQLQQAIRANELRPASPQSPSMSTLPKIPLSQVVIQINIYSRFDLIRFFFAANEFVGYRTGIGLTYEFRF